MQQQNPHYDTIADAYANPRQDNICTRLYQAFHFRTMLDMITDNLSNMRVLDCMSGSCEFAWTAKERVGSLHATDISSGILSKATTKPLPDTRTCADARQLPFADNSFDAVFISGGLHHVREFYEPVLQDLFRIIKNGGWVVAAEPNDDNPFVHLMRGILHIVSPLYEEGERGFRKNEIVAGFQRNGFSEVRHKQHGYLAYALIGNTDVFPLFSGLRNERIINWLLSADHRSPDIPFWRSFALAHIISARVRK